jgi:hypothetical protein
MIRYAGIAGILAGSAIVGEFVLFMASGFTPETFGRAESALPFLADSGALVRAAVLFGAAGVALRTIFVAGLASHLGGVAPTRAAASLYFGLLGGVGHGLVALSFWLGIPMLLALAGDDAAAAAGAWAAYSILTAGFEGFGNLLLGLSMLAAGSAIVSTRLLPVGLGWLGIIAGVLAVLRVVATGTPLSGLVFVVFLPSLILAAAFLIWAGRALRTSPGAVPGELPAMP